MDFLDFENGNGKWDSDLEMGMGMSFFVPFSAIFTHQNRQTFIVGFDVF